MKNALPSNAKIAKEAKECVQECVSEFISFLVSLFHPVQPVPNDLNVPILCSVPHVSHRKLQIRC
jgi:hypothetical protein